MSTEAVSLAIIEVTDYCDVVVVEFPNWVVNSNRVSLSKWSAQCQRGKSPYNA